MTSGSLYFKLLREDLKRRTWAIAVVFLAFFFSLPIGLALTMENAANTDYFIYNDYEDFIQEGVPHDAQWQAELLRLKSQVVLQQAEFGNGMIVFLMVTAAVVMGVSSFSYLHNRKKVDFYHSIPVRRESLFAAQFTGGIIIIGAAYLINLLFFFGVALSYGVGAGVLMGPMAAGWALNMLYYCLMYAVVAVAMMMTGNLVVGILATGVFFFFLPGIMLLLAGYCETFFITTTRNVWSSDTSPFMWGIKYLSPFSAYVAAVSWEVEDLSKHVAELICSVLAFLAVSLLALELYRKRPSEAAGKAMAFKRSMAPIRMILVLGCGLGGGLFFWMLQSKLKWGLFGIVVAVVIVHCVVEIIYHFDFKKLFSDKIQMAVCLGLGLLVFLSFRFDWYGYDSYVPGMDRIASASLEIDRDSGWLDAPNFEKGKDGSLEMINGKLYADIEANMALTDLEPVLAIAQEGKRRAVEARNTELENSNIAAYSMDDNAVESVSIIGGADGPTSVFLASKLTDSREKEEERFFTQVTVCYNLTNGRKVRRTYRLPLAAVMDSYERIHDQKDYKQGLYSVLRQDPARIRKVFYWEAGYPIYTGDESGMMEELLQAYQQDMTDLTVSRRLAEMPVGSIGFMTQDCMTYLQQEKQRRSQRGSYRSGDTPDYTQFWPVYPSFARTIEVLEKLGIKPGDYFSIDNVKHITADVSYYLYDRRGYGDLPEGAELEEIQKQNPYYNEKGYLDFKDKESIARMMNALVPGDSLYMNRLYVGVGDPMNIEVITKDDRTISAQMIDSKAAREAAELFKGIPDMSE